MSKWINQLGSTTYFKLDDVAATIAASPGTYTYSFWTFASTMYHGDNLIAIATSASVNTANRAFLVSASPNQLIQQIAGSGVGAAAIRGIPTIAGWQLITGVFKTTTGASGFSGAKMALDGGTLSAVLNLTDVALAIDNLSLGALRWNLASPSNHSRDRLFAYFGLWSGELSQANVTKLATHAPHLVDTSNLIFGTDKDLAYRAGSSSTAFVTVGSDVATSQSNPSLVTSLGGGLLLTGVN